MEHCAAIADFGKTYGVMVWANHRCFRLSVAPECLWSLRGANVSARNIISHLKNGLTDLHHVVAEKLETQTYGFRHSAPHRLAYRYPKDAIILAYRPSSRFDGERVLDIALKNHQSTRPWLWLLDFGRSRLGRLGLYVGRLRLG